MNLLLYVSFITILSKVSYSQEEFTTLPLSNESLPQELKKRWMPHYNVFFALMKRQTSLAKQGLSEGEQEFEGCLMVSINTIIALFYLTNLTFFSKMRPFLKRRRI